MDAKPGFKVNVKPGVIRGTGVIRDKFGKVKGSFTLDGETNLSKDELVARGMKFTDGEK